MQRSSGSRDSTAAWARRPSIATDRVAQLALGGVLLVGGLAGVLGCSMHASAGRPVNTAFLVLSALTALAGLGLLRLAPDRCRPALLHAAAAGGALEVALGVAASSSPLTGTTTAFLYLPVVVVVICCCTPRAAVVHLVWSVSLIWAALATVEGFGGLHVVLAAATALITAMTARWLVVQADASERDPVTDLPNRPGLDRLLREGGTGREAADGPAAGGGAAGGGASTEAGWLVLLDLDGFTAVNTAGGRAAGDRLLHDVAVRWTAVLGRDAHLSRFEADCFAVLLPPAAAVDPVVAALRAALPAGVTCSVGAAERGDGEDVNALVARAHTALLAVRGTGATEVHQDLAQCAAELRGAIARGEMEVHVQPVVEIATGLTRGVEALVRWRHPQRGLVPPGDFLPLAERTGAIVELGSWVLHESCRQAAGWPRQVDGFPLRVAVNASGAELADAGYALTVEQALVAAGLPADQLCVELVESAYDTSSPGLVANLARLRELGVRTAIDDFGTGWSSLDRVARLGAAILKIDQSFVSDITGEDEEHPVVEAIIALARAMSMDVVAEGVEELHQLRWLERHGVGYAQGYLLARPAPGTPRLEHAHLLAPALHGAGGPGAQNAPDPARDCR